MDQALPHHRCSRKGGGEDATKSEGTSKAKMNEPMALSADDDAWAAKEISLDSVASKISNGSSIYIGSTASTPEATLGALVKSWTLADIQILQMIPGGNLPHQKEHPDSFRTRSFYSFQKTTFYKPDDGVKDTTTDANQQQFESLADYTPMSISAIPRLLRENKLHVDVAIIKVTEPHKGFVSLGFGVEYTRDFIRHAKLVIAEVTHHMPWTEGPSKIAVSRIDWWVRCDSEPLLTTEQLWPEFIHRQVNFSYPQSVLDGLGKNILQHIPDGATIKAGVSPLVFSVFPFLRERRDLGLHTDVFTESLYRLQMAGIINNSKKTIDRGRSVVSQAHGSQELYDFLDRNPAIEVHPSNYINDPQTLAKIDNFVAIIGALKVDLTGQVATDSIAHKFYGGVWSDDDSVTGARLSKGGKAIVVLPSKSLQGRSNIVFALPLGTGVSITRSDVEYVVTEYGTAYLYGKSIRERCLALIDVAHPDFRQELLVQAKGFHYISSSQPGLSFKSKYPQEFECFHTTKTGKAVFCRPIKAVDEDQLRSFFHKLSDHSVYLRYFRKVKSIPQRVLKKMADLDYSTDMALVVFAPPDAANQELVGLAQWIMDNKDGVPEIAFQVRDDMQGEGLGTFLFARLLEIARSYDIFIFKADVLADNRSMRRVFEKSAVPCTCRADFGVVSYTFDLSANGTRT